MFGTSEIDDPVFYFYKLKIKREPNYFLLEAFQSDGSKIILELVDEQLLDLVGVDYGSSKYIHGGPENISAPGDIYRIVLINSI